MQEHLKSYCLNISSKNYQIFAWGRAWTRDPMWAYFEQVREGGSLKAKCRCCGKLQSNKACRMRDHHRKCSPQPKSTPQQTTIPEAIFATTSDSRIETLSLSPTTEQPQKKKGCIDNFVIRTSIVAKNNLDLKVAKIFTGVTSRSTSSFATLRNIEAWVHPTIIKNSWWPITGRSSQRAGKEFKRKIGWKKCNFDSRWLEQCSQWSNCGNIATYCRNHHKPAAWLKEREGSVKPQLPGDTRWESQVQCVDTFLRNGAHYMAATCYCSNICNIHKFISFFPDLYCKFSILSHARFFFKCILNLIRLPHYYFLLFS